jgi:nitroreductase
VQRESRIDAEGLDLAPQFRTATVELMATHESIRRFRPDPVPDGALDALLVAARSAPTSSNLQAYSIVVVTERDRRARLATLVGNQRYVAEAPVFLVFCADIARLRHVSARQGREFAATTLEMFLLASLDAGFALQNAALAAESLGMGTCCIGSIRNDPDAVAAELDLPRGVYAVVGLCVGYEAADCRRGVKPRLPAGATVHHERYDASGLEEHLRAYDATMIARGSYTGRQVQTGDGEQSDVYGWAEHTARRTSRPETLLGPSASLREGLRESVERQGFDIR